MNRFIKLVIFIIFLLFFFSSKSIADLKKFGSLETQIDEKEPTNFNIQRALLYRNVSIEYDTTILIQNENSSQLLFFPQISSGETNILRIIFGDFEFQKKIFFDIYFMLEDSIPDSLAWTDESDKIFLAVNGNVKSFQPQSKNINGYILFDRSDDGEIISGKLEMGFDITVLRSESEYNYFKIIGSFNLAVGEYRELTLGEKISDVDKKTKQRQNIYLAVIFAVFLVAIFGFR
jgi:hypothetical protein